MDRKVVDFLNNERVAVLATMLADGTPHTSAMHFIYHDGALYFSTQPTSRKAKDLSGITKASVTVGFSEKDWITIQLDGTLEKTEFAEELHVAKYPEDAEHIGEEAFFLKFTPTWWRYTDFKTNPPTFIETNNGF